MVTRFVIKDAHVPAGIVETMERRIHQRMDAYFKDEAEGDTVKLHKAKSMLAQKIKHYRTINSI